MRILWRKIQEVPQPTKHNLCKATLKRTLNLNRDKRMKQLTQKRSLCFKFDSRVVSFDKYMFYNTQSIIKHLILHEKLGKLNLYLKAKTWVLVLYTLWSKGKLSESTQFVCLECLAFCWININALLETDCSAVYLLSLLLLNNTEQTLEFENRRGRKMEK